MHCHLFHKKIWYQYGQYQNVFLSDDESAQLQIDYPDQYEDYINRLSVYMETSGKHYASHYATIRKWTSEDSKTNGGKNFDADYENDKGDCL